jgi:hypothetical protein
MADEFESLADRAEHYRRIAALIRSRVSSTQSAEARADLDTLASDYEILAEHAERCRRSTKADETSDANDPSRVADGVSMTRYRKKPVVIEAVQVAAAVYNGKTWNESPFKCDALPQWLQDAFTNGTIAVHPSARDFALLAIKAPEGTMIAEPGDWIIRGVKGELYPCKPDIFGATYEPVVAASFKER